MSRKNKFNPEMKNILTLGEQFGVNAILFDKKIQQIIRKNKIKFKFLMPTIGDTPGLIINSINGVLITTNNRIEISPDFGCSVSRLVFGINRVFRKKGAKINDYRESAYDDKSIARRMGAKTKIKIADDLANKQTELDFAEKESIKKSVEKSKKRKAKMITIDGHTGTIEDLRALLGIS